MRVPYATPPSASEASAEYVRRQLVAVLAATGIIMMAYGAHATIRGWYKVTVVYAVTLVAIGWLRLAAARTHAPATTRRLAAGMLGLSCILFFAASLVAGQSKSTGPWWFMVVPLLAANVLGTRAALRWSFVALAGGAAVYATDLFVTIPPDGGYPGVLDTAISRVFMLVVIAVLSIVVRRFADLNLSAAISREETIRDQADVLEWRVQERTRDLEEANRQLAHQAFVDQLTGLPNRWLLADRLQSALARGARGPGSVAVCMIDLDRFKVVNDSVGHTAGDGLLRAVAERLEGAIPPGDTLARFGGDEFVVVVEGLPTPHAVAAVAGRLQGALAVPFPVADGGSGSQDVFVTASAGIAVATHPGESPEDLLRHADVALYRAKDRGRGRYEIFDDRLRSQIRETLRTETALHRAFDNDEFEVHYQPIVSLRTERPVAAEALVRWRQPGRGLLGAAAFIGLAEETGLVVPLGAWVLEQACRWAGSPAGLPVHVNVSARQLSHPRLIDDVTAAVRDGGCKPSHLCLEITETMLMADPEDALDRLNELAKLGCHVAVDDFGTGYSSLGYLKRFPVDVLKLDRTFVTGLDHDPQDRAIVRATIDLARALEIDVVAEGVETRAQRDTLVDLGCLLAQGWLFGKPAPPQAFPGNEQDASVGGG